VALASGTRFGPYQIAEPIGAGGMGEVYRALDTSLGRSVAIKVLPEEFAQDAERLARFEREARTLASLNHPNIATIHGLEKADLPAGSAHGAMRALVMELVDGPTLADRIADGPIVLDEALAIARQITEALEAAHKQGIIHRDLKPANIKVRPDGTVKVLDFGLAKALAPEPAAAAARQISQSPTITSPVAVTGAGVLLGTAAYMSPEQARGKAADKRSDIWAFGTVVYEMLTGKRAFDAGEVSDTLAWILTKDPDWSALPAAVPLSIRTLLRRCLTKDRRRRLDSASDARLEIDDAADALVHGEPLTAGAARVHSRWPPRIAAAALTVAAVALVSAWILTRPGAVAPAAVSRFAITLPAAQPIALSFNDRDLALSADGTRLAYTAGDQARLMLRAFDRLDALPVANIVNARAPFFSPNGDWIGYFDRLDEGPTTGPVLQHGALKKVSASGGPPIAVAQLTGASRGASWAADDAIVFATSDTSTGLLRVGAGGGEVEVLTKPAEGELDHYFPSVLPGARGVLFTISHDKRLDRQVAVLDTRTGERRTLIASGSQAVYVNTGHLIYEDGEALWAVGFDLASLRVIGGPVLILEQVLTLAAAAFTISNGGSLVYVPQRRSSSRSLVWVARDGREDPIAAPDRAYTRARISPDGKRVAVQISEDGHHIWIWDIERQTWTRLTFGPDSHGPVWSHDGRHVLYSSKREGPAFANLFRRLADGTGPEERLTTSVLGQRVNVITRDGSRVIFEQLTPPAGYDFMSLSLTGSAKEEPLLQTPFDERDAAISPDGRWMVYESNQTGQAQIYVRPFPNVADALYQITSDGGRTPIWSPTGRELFFVNRSSLMVTPVELTPFSAGTPSKLFDAPSMVLDGRIVAVGTVRTYDISRDGKRFLMIKENAASGEDEHPASMIVVQNWHEELKRLVPAR
jgi:eukaryotic-like serine/threonine-protein kinase